MFLWRARRPDDAIQKIIEEAVAADKAGKYAEAVELYASGIEKMMAQMAELPNEEAKTQSRLKINEYMLRAEYIKDWMADQARTQQTQNTSVPSTQGSNARATSGRQEQRGGYSKQHAEHAHTILDEVLDHSPGVHWTDIAGLDVAKQILQEAVILPTLRPDLFTGLRAPPRGVLLFGPPGTGKTLLAKAVATEAKATFFNISASSLTSKWVGEGEKLVRALFEMARELQPSVVFMDEIDALLSTRSASENDASRRIKNQFFIELDGAASSQEDRVLVMGATNLPQELDEAIVRRLEKRIYVPLPDPSSREGLIRHLLRSQKFSLSSRDFKLIVKVTEGYSGSDLKAVCKDAALGPIRELGAKVANVKAEDVRGINASDFQVALTRVRPSVSSTTIQDLVAWNEQYGVSAA
ncbi:spastin and Fidgetin-like protein [Phytophthora infestans T30-4]|uniref:microtubule-severing ATPase n=2 Tax=Phytophthora infestans TaxID=4787 RepID=D0MZT8_PHYIT|nr:spastin and Fidgetin-like protein [Phytophthora infestans T30-4]EEY65751.1 spastin and Fidgetin-like protein [Phytophthora infestans T30-4]KAF4047230.1 ATPase family associated domain-containing protein lid 3 [Phytophthora infestans]|eukprot:XP_002906350.1 spastin and Fidgetin-like protein [Phytophthora infestans T30-4]